jgi:hypothetical protein
MVSLMSVLRVHSGDSALDSCSFFGVTSLASQALRSPQVAATRHHAACAERRTNRQGLRGVRKAHAKNWDPVIPRLANEKPLADLERKQ